jgi:uncharacterized protein YjbJ (UPF0337 family)
MINQEILKGEWNRIRGRLKQRWGQLTDDDVAVFNGNVDQLVGAIQRKTGEARESVEGFLERVVEEGSSLLDQARDAASLAAEQVRDKSSQVRDALYDGVESAEECVRERPGQAVLVSFGAGILIGLGIAALLYNGRSEYRSSRVVRVWHRGPRVGSGKVFRKSCRNRYRTALRHRPA